MDRLRPIGVFDSGIGGLSVLAALRAEMPAEHFVYISDSGHAPYGERTDAYIIQRSLAVTHHLAAAHNVKAVVVACNTATAAAIGPLRQAFSTLTIVGVEPALKPALAHSRTGLIGVIGTRATLTSTKFKALLHSLEKQANFVVQPCDGLARTIEQAGTQVAQPQSASETRALCAEYTAAMGVFGTQTGTIDTLVLGCTHYVFATSILRELLGPDVGLIDTGVPVARHTRRLLAAANALASVGDGIYLSAGNSSQPDDPGNTGNPASYVPNSSAELHAVQFITTGDPARLRAAAQRWLQIPEPSVAFALT